MDTNAPRARRPLQAVDNSAPTPTLDTPYTGKESPLHPPPSHRLASSAPLADNLFSMNSWLVQDPVLAKEKAAARASAVGPLERLGGGLERLSRVECMVLAAITLLATFVRLWRIDRPSSVVFDEVRRLPCVEPSNTAAGSLWAASNEVHQAEVLHGPSTLTVLDQSNLHNRTCIHLWPSS
jgi:hypothetical protein